MKLAIIEAPFIPEYTFKTLLLKFAQGFPSDIECNAIGSYLATSIADDHEVKYFDANIDKNILKKVRKFTPDILLFLATKNMPSPSLNWIYDTSESLKNELKCKIILAGPHISVTPKQTLETTCADFVLIGEGDFVFPSLINYLEGKGKLPKLGIGYKKNGKIIITKPAIVNNLDKLPIPSREFFTLKKYKVITIETSRGCFRKCDFCYQSAIPAGWRARSVESLKKEINYIVSNYDLKGKKIYIVDNNFLVNEKRIRKFSQFLIKEKFNLEWFGMTEVGSCNKKTLEYISKAGCIDLLIGIETGSPRIAKRFPKLNCGYARILEFIKKINECEIQVTPSFILMHVGETKEDLITTLRLARKIKVSIRKETKTGNKVRFEPHLFRLIPKTPVYRELLKLGFKAPKSFKEWGILLQSLAYLKNLDKLNFTKNLRERDIINALLEFGILNMNEKLKGNSLLKIKKYFKYALEKF